MTRWAAAGALALALAPVAAAAAPGTTIVLPTPLQPLSTSPPVGGPPLYEADARIVHRVSSDVRVDVSIDAGGAPFRVVATQRLVVLRRGDYAYVIQAPLVDAGPAPGTQSAPGVRRDAIVWSGFDPGRRVLAARATLRAGEAGASLPLRIVVRDGAVVLENATVVTTTAQAARVDPAALRRALATMADQALGRRAVTSAPAVTALPPIRTVTTSVEAPLRVTGTIGGRRVDVVLGDGRPLRAVFPDARAPVRLRVAAVPPLRTLAAATTLRDAMDVLHRFARVRQFEQFLANPDPGGANRTAYAYRTAARPAPVAAAPVSTGASGPWRTIGFVGAALVAAAAGLAIWARF